MKAVQYTSVFIRPEYKYYILQSNHKAVGVLLSFCLMSFYIYKQEYKKTKGHQLENKEYFPVNKGLFMRI